MTQKKVRSTTKNLEQKNVWSTTTNSGGKNVRSKTKMPGAKNVKCLENNEKCRKRLENKKKIG